MPTNEERREVAERLREVIANLNNIHMPRGINQSSFIYLTELSRALGNDGNIFTRLADLIEPEQERTCRMNMKGPQYVLSGWWECDKCGVVYPPCNEEIAKWALQYCPHCGAKVVS